jgi:uncharacterized membrane protein
VTTAPARAAAVASLAWLLVVVVAPLAPAWIAAPAYAAASHVCHQRPERSFHLAAAQLPVCARCAGAYAGAALVAAAWLTGWWRPARRLRQRAIRSWAAAGVAPTVLSIAAEWGGLPGIDNPVRAVAGFVLGLAAARMLMPELHWWSRDAGAPAASIRS